MHCNRQSYEQVDLFSRPRITLNKKITFWSFKVYLKSLWMTKIIFNEISPLPLQPRSENVN